MVVTVQLLQECEQDSQIKRLLLNPTLSPVATAHSMTFQYASSEY